MAASAKRPVTKAEALEAFEPVEDESLKVKLQALEAQRLAEKDLEAKQAEPKAAQVAPVEPEVIRRPPAQMDNVGLLAHLAERYSEVGSPAITKTEWDAREGVVEASITFTRGGKKLVKRATGTGVDGAAGELARALAEFEADERLKA